MATTKKRVSYFYDAEIGNYHYGQGHPMKVTHLLLALLHRTTEAHRYSSDRSPTSSPVQRVCALRRAASPCPDDPQPGGLLLALQVRRRVSDSSGSRDAELTETLCGVSAAGPWRYAELQCSE